MAKSRINLRVLVILVCTFALSSNAYSQDIHLKSEKSNIKYIESPESISEEQVSLSDLDLKSRELQETDLIIINTKNGKPILPDYKQAIEEPAIYPANEINFTFDSPDYPWTATELESLQTWVDDFYPMVKLIYG
ncbi:MAG: hypothetical protein JRF49_11730, partial [Deltaproteobacteria bacterium]|nr:hypothetical protein [Deltaproteobacteria bacterium]